MIYLILKAAVFIFLLYIPLGMLYFIVKEGRENLRKGIGILISWVLGYGFYMMYKLSQSDVYYSFLDIAYKVFDYEEGRLLLQLICIVLGVVLAKFYCKAFKDWKDQNFILFMIIFIGLIHSALTDVFLTLDSNNDAGLKKLLPTFSFVVGISLYTGWRLFKTEPETYESNDHESDQLMKRQEELERKIRELNQ